MASWKKKQTKVYTVSQQVYSKQHLYYTTNDEKETRMMIPKPIIHLKGFARDIDFRDSSTKELSNSCVNKICHLLKNGGTLVWDGDSFRTNSFTVILQRVSHQIRKNNANYMIDDDIDINTDEPKWLFVTVKKYCNVRKAINSWKRILSQDTPLLIIKIPNQWKDFVQVNTQTLKLTESDTIIVFGGGRIVKKEYKEIREKIGKNVEFYVYNVGRYNSKANKYEYASLSAFKIDHNLHLIEAKLCGKDNGKINGSTFDNKHKNRQKGNRKRNNRLVWTPRK